MSQQPMKNQTPRWEFSDDRHYFSRWVESRRPAKQIDWQWTGQKLILMVEQKDRRRWLDLDAETLHCFRPGWRVVVALSIKRCRKDLFMPTDTPKTDI